MNRILAGLLVLLATTSCRDREGRPDAAVATGGASGTGGVGGAGGMTPADGAGGVAPPDGTGGVAPADGGGGVAVDALVDRVSGGDDEDGPAGTTDAVEGGLVLEPIRVSGGNSDASVPYHDLRFVGSQLDQYEGAVVTFRIGLSSVYRGGSGQVRIVQGSFDVLFPQVVAPDYEQKLAQIDADGSGACEVGEPAFYDSALDQADTTLTVTPSDIRFRPAVGAWCDQINSPPIQ